MQAFHSHRIMDYSHFFELIYMMGTKGLPFPQLNRDKSGNIVGWSWDGQRTMYCSLIESDKVRVEAFEGMEPHVMPISNYDEKNRLIDNWEPSMYEVMHDILPISNYDEKKRVIDICRTFFKDQYHISN
jgi:hypothetical protein